MRTLTLAAAVLLLAASPALAQTTQPAEPQAAPIVNGHPVQPHPAPEDAAKPDSEAQRLLKTPDNGPTVEPHDLYGKPLGGSPGLNPPGAPPAGK